MDKLAFDLQRFSVMPTLLNGEDGGGVRYWNTIPGAEVSGFGNTFFVNHGAGCVIYCDGDNTKVYNDPVAPNVVINGAGGRDWLINDAVNVKVNGNAGKDDILNHANNVELYGDTGDDAMQNQGGSQVTIDGGADNDWIYNSGSDVKIYGGTGTDNIENHGDTVSVDAGDNDDHIYNSGKEVTINAGAGDDHIGNTNSSVTIKAGTGKDSIYNDSGSVKVYATDDDIGDYFYNEGSKVTITAGAGDDCIDNRYSNAEHQGSSVTIDAGDGKNQISLDGGNNISVKAGANADIIIANASSGEFHDMTIEAGNGQNLVSVGSGWSYVTINGGDDTEGADAIFNNAKNAFVKGNAGNDFIRNYGDNAVVSGGDDGDIIENYGNNVFIQGDNAKGKSARNVGDYISTDKGTKVTIEAGDNDDTILAFHDVESSIMGGSGNDSISLSRIDAKELDKISNKGLSHVGWFINDLIPFSPIPNLEGLLEDAGWENPASWASAESILIKVGDYLVKKGLTTEISKFFFKEVLKPISTVKTIFSGIKDFANFVSYINILSKTSTVNGGTGDDTIVSDGFTPRIFEYATGDGNDAIYRLSVDSTLKSVLNRFTDDNFLSTIHITQGTIKKITLDNVKIDRSDVVINVDDGSIKLVEGDDKKFKIRESDGTTTTLAYKCDPDRADTICSIFGGSESEIIQDTISGAIYRNVLDGGGGDDLLIGTVKEDTLVGGSGKDTLLGDDSADNLYGGTGNDSLIGGEGDDILYGEGNNDTLLGEAGNDKLWGGEGDDSLVGGDNDDTLSGSLGKDTLIGGEGDDSLWGGYNADLFLYADGDGKDSIKGIEANDTLEVTEGLISSATVSGSDVILTIGTGSIKLIDGVNKKFNLREANGTLTTRAYGKDSSGEVVCSLFGSAKDDRLMDNVGIKRQSYIIAPGDTPPKDPVIGTVNKNVIYGNGGKDTLIANDKDTTLDGGLGDDILYGGDAKEVLNGGYGKDKLYGGAGADILDGGSWDDTLTGGWGADTFIYSDGKDVITDYAANFDKISLAGGNNAKYLSHITGVKISGTDVKLTFSKNSGKTLTLNGAKGKKVIVNGATRIFNNDNVITTGDKQYATLTADFSGKFVASSYRKVDASAVTNSTTITGCKNVIGGKKTDYIAGTSGADTLEGGKGDDKLWGGNGADKFIYNSGDGKDIIYGFDDTDMLEINGNWTANYYEGSGRVVFKVGMTYSAIILENSTASTFNVNGNRYQIADSKLVRI